MKADRLRPCLCAALALGLCLPSLPVAGKGPADYELERQVLMGGREENFDNKKPWAEAEYQLPPVPDPKNLVPISVSNLTDNQFAVDVRSVTFGSDEVVRYTLVVSSSRGARNVSYEGMRCATGERRIYALGRSDGSWSKARSSQWQRITDSNLNRHHAALFKDYFCTPGGVVRDTDEARSVFPRGNPAAEVGLP